MKAWVYIHRDAGNEVIYVGASIDPRSRTDQHAKSSDWFDLVRTIDVIPYETKEEALQEETRLILLIKPKFNRSVIVDGKLVRVSWKDELRSRFMKMRNEVIREIDEKGVLAFSKLIGCSLSTTCKMLEEKDAFLTARTLDKLDAYFEGRI